MKPTTIYLTVYNIVLCLLWATLLVEGIQKLNQNAPAREYWNAIKTRLLIAQHLALLEIVHSAIGIVGSPLIATTIQVVSRLYMLDLFTYPAETCWSDFSLYLMVVSWSLVETPRYSFYAVQILAGEKNVPAYLFFLRYSLFMVLYPTGISGEILQQIASYPYWNKNMPIIARFSHVVIVLLYVPLGPFMIYNMWMMRKRAMKKRSELLNPSSSAAAKPMQGLVWPITNMETKERSTTDTAKKIFAAAARGGNNEEIAKSIEKDRNWRFGYVKHIVSHVTLSCESSETCLKVAQAGLDSAYSLFKYAQADGKEISYGDALQQKSGGKIKKFFTGIKKGIDADVSGVVHTLQVPYKGKMLEGDELLRQCDEWTRKGTIENSAGESIKQCAVNAEKWMDLSDVLFVMLGATSAMGPLDNLLAHGATVVCIDLKRPQIWEKLFSKVALSRGTIVYPLSKDGLKTEKEQTENAGCDMLQDVFEICDWLEEVVDQFPNKRVVCGNYTYLDGALHVQLALAGDAIMQRLCKKCPKQLTLAFLCTPTDDHVIPPEARDDARNRFKSVPFWQQILHKMGVLIKNFRVPVVNDLCVVDAIVSRQGPNYALAKRIQHWRALIARSQGHIVSSNIAPSTATQSVLSNPQFAAGYFGWRYFSPLEVFMQETSGAVMFALFINDLRDPTSKANPKVILSHPLTLFSHQSFHGGIWRCPFTIDSLGVPAALTFYVQKYGAFAVAALAVVIAAINYVIFGRVF